MRVISNLCKYFLRFWAENLAGRNQKPINVKSGISLCKNLKRSEKIS